MSGHRKSVNDLPPEGERLDLAKFPKNFLNILLGVGGIFALIFIIGFLASDSDGNQQKGMAYSYLYAFFFFFTLGMGSLFWVLLHHATNSGWGVAIRRIPEQVSCMLGVLFIFGLPLLLPAFHEPLWEWTGGAARIDADSETFEERVKKKFGDDSEKIVAELKGFDVEKDFKNGFFDKPAQQHTQRKAINQLHIYAEAGKLDGLAPVTLDSKLRKAYFTEADTLLAGKAPFLNVPFWVARYVIFFGLVLTGAAFYLRRLSLKADSGNGVQHSLWARRMSCGILPLFALSATMLCIDWVMALDYTWFSTMWGVYIFAGSALNSMALAILILTLLRHYGYLHKVTTLEHYHIMGKLLFAFTVFWAYIGFSQYFLIWYANITEETRFFLLRNTEGWNTVSILLMFCHFVIPFVLLLNRGLKKNTKTISAICVWTLWAHALDHYWLIIPERGPSLTHGTELIIAGAWIWDVVAMIMFGGLLAFIFFKFFLSRHPLYPKGDARLEESINLVN